MSKHGKEIAQWNAREEMAPAEGPLIKEGQQLFGLFQNYKKVLNRDEQAGEPCLVIPQVVTYRHGPTGRGPVISGYFFVGQKELKQSFPTISALVNPDNSDANNARRLSINVKQGIATDIDTGDDFSDKELLSALIGRAAGNLEVEPPLSAEQVTGFREKSQLVIAIGQKSMQALQATSEQRKGLFGRRRSEPAAPATKPSFSGTGSDVKK